MRHRLLIVDDEPLILKTLSKALRNDFELDVAHNGAVALEHLKRRRYDFVLTDLMMPDITGIDVLREAKNNDPDICVCILTGYGDMPTAIEAFKNKADDFLTKPCGIQEIRNSISECLANREKKRAIKFAQEYIIVCCKCGKIKENHEINHMDDAWLKPADFIYKTTGIKASHSYCPECYKIARQELEEYLTSLKNAQ